MVEKIEMVMSGLVMGGQVRTQGEVIDMPDGFPVSPEDQMAKWHGKVYYVVVDSNLDNAKAKEILGKQEEDLVKTRKVEVSPQLSEEGAVLLGDVKSNQLSFDDLPNVIPDYFNAEDEMEEMDLEKGKVEDAEEKEEEIVTTVSETEEIDNKGKKKAKVKRVSSKKKLTSKKVK